MAWLEERWAGPRRSSGTIASPSARQCSSAPQTTSTPGEKPELPQDLCLLRGNDDPWLVTIAHETDGYLRLSPEEKLRLVEALPRMGPLLRDERGGRRTEARWLTCRPFSTRGIPRGGCTPGTRRAGSDQRPRPSTTPLPPGKPGPKGNWSDTSRRCWRGGGASTPPPPPSSVRAWRGWSGPGGSSRATTERHLPLSPRCTALPSRHTHDGDRVVQEICGPAGPQSSRAPGPTSPARATGISSTARAVLEDLDASGNPLARYTTEDGSYSGSLLHIQRATGESRFPLLDGIGTVRGLADPSATVTDTYDTDAFGRPLGDGTGSTPNPYQFGGAWGYQTDPSGLQHLGAREYWPELGGSSSRTRPARG